MQVSLKRLGFICCMICLTQAGKVKGGWKSKSPSKRSYFLRSQDSQFLTSLPCITTRKKPRSGSSFLPGTQRPKAYHPEALCLKASLLKMKGAAPVLNGPSQLASMCWIWGCVEAWTPNQFNLSTVSSPVMQSWLRHKQRSSSVPSIISSWLSYLRIM